VFAEPDTRLSLFAPADAACPVHVRARTHTHTQVHLISIMLGHERIRVRTSHNKFVHALELAMSFYEESGLAAVGMPKSRAERRKVSSGWVDAWDVDALVGEWVGGCVCVCVWTDA
jgi:hypothetical protein